MRSSYDTLTNNSDVISRQANRWNSSGFFGSQDQGFTYLTVAFVLYSVGILGIIFNCKNLLVTIMSIELIYLGVITSFVLHGVSTGDHRGVIYGLLILILAACESAVGLGVIIVLYRFGGSIDFTAYEELGG